jgi:hypothetical protein
LLPGALAALLPLGARSTRSLCVLEEFVVPDIAAITAVLSSLRTATDIAKLLRETDLSLEKADLKLKLADLVGSLADAKMQLSEIQELLGDRDKRIKELEEAFQSKHRLVRVRDAYYRLDDQDRPSGEPHCIRCWDVDHKQYKLQYDAKDRFVKVCPACKHRHEGRMAIRIDPDAKKDA